MIKESYTVVQGDELIEGAYKITIDEFRLLNLALSKIDSVDIQPNHPYVITADDFQKAYGINTRYVNPKLKESARSLLRKPITLFTYNAKKGKVVGSERPWFSLIEFDPDTESSVNLYFSEFVRPYLYELKKNFTQIKFHYLAALDTSFSVRLYMWLCQARRKANKDVTSVTLNIDWIKNRAGLIGKYDDYRILRRKLIEPAIEKINANTDLSVIFEPIRTGKLTTDIAFHFVDEKESKGTLSRPVRQRLPRRPKVVTGSSAEGEWARKCITVMNDYDLELINHGYQLSVDDLKKLQKWYLIIGDNFSANDVKKEIEARSRNRA